MAPQAIDQYLSLLGPVMASPGRSLWSTYDADTDTLYIHFKPPAAATDSELTDDDVIVRFEGDQIIGLTILHASTRRPAA